MDSADRGRRSLLRLTGAGLALGFPSLAAPAEEAPKRGAKNGGRAKEDKLLPAEELMQEHGLLNRVLLLYEESLRRMVSREIDPMPEVLVDAASVIRRIIEDHHQKLEETYIFPRLEKAQQHLDLISVLRDQHVASRRATDVVLKAKSGALNDPAGRVQLENAMRDFIRMYRPHHAREDTVIFPAFRKLLSKREYEALGDQFENEQRKLLGETSLDSVAERLSTLEREMGIYDLSKLTLKK